MEFLNKIEKTVFGWFKTVPDLPAGGRKWLGDNAWWIVLIGAILTVLAVLGTLSTITTRMSLLGSIAATYYVSSATTSWLIVADFVSLGFMILQAILLFMAIQPLKEKQKKGWVLLFASWLLSAIAVVVNAVLGLSIFGFFFAVIFGAVGLAITGYFLFEIHGQFAHVERSRGVKKDVKSTK